MASGGPTSAKEDQRCRKKTKNLEGCDRLLETYLQMVPVDRQHFTAAQKRSLNNYTVELLKSLKDVLMKTGSTWQDSKRLSRLVRKGSYRRELKTFPCTPRPPFLLLLEMGKVFEEDILGWLRQIYVGMRLPHDVENPLSARTMCYCFRSHSTEAVFYGACVGSFVGAEKLRKYFIAGLKKGWFTDSIVSALESVRDDVVESRVPFDSEVECSAFQFGNKNKVFDNMYKIGPCYRCKMLFQGVNFTPDRNRSRGDEGFEWGNCAEYYAFSQLCNASDAT
ncbi:uncharacterized protein [Ptychodera flava]|uniref:uncharacterized protein n=1 Tax=Ptychodera flava TaxID=63121 RepID=UPI00396A1839